MAKLAFLGLGVMGFPMAGHLAHAGHEVTVYNRTAAKAGAWMATHGGRWHRPRHWRPKGPISFWPVSAMTTICDQSAWAKTGPLPG